MRKLRKRMCYWEEKDKIIKCIIPKHNKTISFNIYIKKLGEKQIIGR